MLRSSPPDDSIVRAILADEPGAAPTGLAAMHLGSAVEHLGAVRLLLRTRRVWHALVVALLALQRLAHPGLDVVVACRLGGLVVGLVVGLVLGPGHDGLPSRGGAVPPTFARKG